LIALDALDAGRVPDQSLLAVQLSESFGDWMAGAE
jgi:hypothetical protein